MTEKYVDVPQLQDTQSKDGFTTEALALAAQYEVRFVNHLHLKKGDTALKVTFIDHIGFESVGRLCEEQWDAYRQTGQGCRVRVPFAAWFSS
jgi:hypothetical protein